MSSFAPRCGVLHAERTPLDLVAAAHGTPLYVYSRGAIEHHYGELVSALSAVEHLVCYSVKANPTGAVLRLLAERGSGCDVVSGGELARALRAGFPPDRIVFSGVGKTEDEIAAALEARILCLNVESEPELRAVSRVATARGLVAPVALRVNPDIAAGSHAYVETGKAGDKFGVPWEDAPRLYRLARGLPGLLPRGVDLHLGSQILRAEPYARAAARVAELVGALRADGFGIDLVDLGGGLGISCGEEPPLTAPRYAAAVLPAIAGLGARLIVEPGRFVVGRGGVLLTRVLYLKDVPGRRYVVVDAAMNDLIRPALYGAWHPILPVRPRPGRTACCDVVGPVCESGDFLGRDRELPPLREGDLLAVLEAGAYGSSMASNYNSRLRPAEVLVEGDRHRLVRRRETLDDLLRLEVE